MRRSALLIALIATLPLLACQSGEEKRPDFLARVQEDCRAGSPEACTLLQLMQARGEAEPVSAPQRRARIRTQAQRNTDAIMQGVERARAAPRPAPTPAPNDGSV